jgi:hypothetical protein
MRTLRSAPVAILASFLLLATTTLAITHQDAPGQDQWAAFVILDHSVLDQDISGDTVIYREIGSPLTLININTKATKVLPVTGPCTDFSIVDDFRIAGEWLVIQFQCPNTGDVMFQSHAYNLGTGETFLLMPDPPIPELPYSWYADIDDGRVVWAQMADCGRGDIYMLDLETRDISKVTEDPGTGARLNLSLGPEWLAWDEFRQGDSLYFDVHAANLVSGETITVTSGLHARGNMPLAGNDVIIWHETSYPREIWALDLTTRDRYQIAASGDYPFAADLSGNLLVLSDQVSTAAGTAPDNSGDQTAGTPNEPCDLPRAGPLANNRLRVYDLVSNSDAFVYYNPEANSEYKTRIDGQTAIWVERVNVDSWHVLAARRFEHQFYMPLIFR